jgi:uncharacterized membrane protein YjfL (UPF0719 family)
MTLDQIVSAIVYLIAVFIIFFVGKFVFDITNPKFRLKEELVERDNFALSLAITGYYLGLIFVIGGILVGPSAGLIDDLFDIFFYGVFAILFLSISNFLNDKLILYKFNNVKEIIDDQNAGTGAIVAGNYIANGLILFGAFSGEGGDLITAVVFWLLGQIGLILVGLIYNLITPYNIHEHIEKDNVAVGVAFGGMLVAIGNVIRIGIEGDFISWEQNLVQFAGFLAVAVILLPVIRLATDKILLPGQNLTDELVNQEKPNVGAGVIEAFSYVAASFILGWII